ncbi:MAG TPA: putative sulfate exporter family transporter, partial [Puia sp.]
MAKLPIEPSETNQPARPKFWAKEDWWAVWLGLGIILLAYVFYLSGSSISWIAVAPAKWSTLSQLGSQLAANAVRYLALLAALLLFFTLVVSFIGQRARDFIPAFIFVFVLSAIIYILGSWDQASRYNLEPPLVALLLGLIISNVNGLPRWFDAGFRVEFYIKLGIVLLGATLPFTLIIWAGPVAILQASIVSVVTFLTIFL